MKLPKTDFHLHSFLKPYGYSKYNNNNLNDASSAASAWFVDKNTEEDNLLENTVGFSSYRQSDLKSCRDANYRLLINSLYPVERGFTELKQTVLGNSIDFIAGKWLIDLVTEFGKVYIGEIRSPGFNYYDDLIRQLDFVQAMHKIKPNNCSSQYQVINSATDLDKKFLDGDLLIINTIEGAHSFCNGNNPIDEEQWNDVSARIKHVKNHPGKPFFVTIAHHFYNGLCSHSESLFSISAFIQGQSYGMKTLKQQKAGAPEGIPICDKEITPIGYDVINGLLDTSNGPRIFIDVKHMSVAARQEFYDYRAVHYPDLPLIYSHGGCYEYYNEEINLNERDILEIAASGGIMGLEIDQRIMGYNEQNKSKRFDRWFRNAFRSDRRQNEMWAEPVWNNMMHIAETCFLNGHDPWKHICLGSDYDGIINPLNEYRTVSQTDELLKCLQHFLEDYWRLNQTIIPKNSGGEPSDVIYRIAYKNVVEFAMNNFK